MTDQDEVGLTRVSSHRNSIQDDVLAILGSDYSDSDVGYYINSTYSTQDYLPQYVEQSETFQSGMPDCSTSASTRRLRLRL